MEANLATTTFSDAACGVLDHRFFGTSFGEAGMRAIFSDRALVGRFAEAEAALARAQARVGVIPADAAAAISAIAAKTAETIDMDRLRAETELVGYPILGLVRQMATAAGPEAGRYVHWGATTQDIMDTGVVLQVRAGLDRIEDGIATFRSVLAGLAEKYRDTVMAGRTHLQHALPITFGYKCAAWLSSFDRHAERLKQVRPRVLLVQFGGAAGTLASLGDGATALAVRKAMAEELGLGEAPITWHAARDGIAEAVGVLALIAGSLGKIAQDVAQMAATEFGEVAEPFVPGRGASSTMPQKRNPISSELAQAAARAVRQHAGLMLDAMIHDHERATGPWHLEWIAVPEAFVMTAGALEQMRFALAGLRVDAARMRKNLDISGGLILAEAVMMALAPHTGRNRAHDLVYDACRETADGGRPLAEALAARPEVAGPLGGAEGIAKLLDPANYLGAAQAMVDRVLAGR